MNGKAISGIVFNTSDSVAGLVYPKNVAAIS
jgi:hypothetical protein